MDEVAALRFEKIGQDFSSRQGGEPLQVLNDISFEVTAGRFISVIGPSGCGKSTLLQMAAGLLKPSRGRVMHNGVRVLDVNRTIGFVPQQAQLLPWKTLLENVEFPLLLRGISPSDRRSRASAAIAKVELEGFEAHYPYQLSGGMQKRASIARMLVYKPDTILMDEPFGALDAQTRMLMQHDLQTMLGIEKASVLFVTHDITEAVMLSDSVLVLSRRPARILAQIPDRPATARETSMSPTQCRASRMPTIKCGPSFEANCVYGKLHDPVCRPITARRR